MKCIIIIIYYRLVYSHVMTVIIDKLQLCQVGTWDCRLLGSSLPLPLSLD